MAADTHSHNTITHSMYDAIFPSKAFNVVFHHAIEHALPSENVKERVENLIDSITYAIFMYTSRGLFERDKLTFVSQVAFQVSGYNNISSTVNCNLQ